jgi:hypothetical protein
LLIAKIAKELTIRLAKIPTVGKTGLCRWKIKGVVSDSEVALSFLNPQLACESGYLPSTDVDFKKSLKSQTVHKVIWGEFL